MDVDVGSLERIGNDLVLQGVKVNFDVDTSRLDQLMADIDTLRADTKTSCKGLRAELDEGFKAILKLVELQLTRCVAQVRVPKC